jgi:hypothetical protein
VPDHQGIGVTASSQAEATRLATELAVRRGWSLDPRLVEQNVDVAALVARAGLSASGDPDRPGIWFPA